MQGDEGRRAQHVEFGDRKREIFLERLSETCNVKWAAQHAGVHRVTAYRHYRLDPDFAARWREALGRASWRS